MTDARTSRGRLRLALTCTSAVCALWTAAAQAQEAPGVDGEPAAAPTAAQPARAAQEQTIDIQAYDVDGATLISQLEIETAVYPYLGPARTSGDVDKAREALEKVYRDKGYQSVVVEIPPQRADQGLVKLSVIETTIGRVRIEGSRYFSPEVIRRQAAALVPGKTPNLTEAQAQIADLNRIPDRRVTPILRAGLIPGTVDVDLKVSDDLPLHVSVELNNDHAQYTSDLRASATVRYTNLWQQGHTASLTYLVSPENRKEAEVFAAFYNAPIWGTPWNVYASAYTSNSNTAALGGTNTLGDGYQVVLGGSYTLPQWRSLSQSFSTAVGYNYTRQRLFIFPKLECEEKLPGTNVSNNCYPISYATLSAGYGAQVSGESYAVNASLNLMTGLRGTGGTAFEFQFQRFNAAGNFVHVNFDADYAQNLPLGFSTFAKWSSQLADGPLLPAEQFSAGGLKSVRGYLQSEAIGDNGILGQFEIRSPNLSPYLGTLAERFMDDWRVYAFSDAAKTWVLEALRDQDPRFTLWSLGVGTRIQLLKYLYGDLLVAWPMMDAPATKVGDDPYVAFSVRSEF